MKRNRGLFLDDPASSLLLLALVGLIWFQGESLRNEIRDLRTEVGDLRTEVHSDVGDLRIEVRTDIGDLHGEVGDLSERVAKREVTVARIEAWRSLTQCLPSVSLSPARVRPTAGPQLPPIFSSRVHYPKSTLCSVRVTKKFNQSWPTICGRIEPSSWRGLTQSLRQSSCRHVSGVSTVLGPGWGSLLSREPGGTSRGDLIGVADCCAKLDRSGLGVDALPCFPDTMRRSVQNPAEH